MQAFNKEIGKFNKDLKDQIKGNFAAMKGGGATNID